jgi:hypothetical protein
VYSRRERPRKAYVRHSLTTGHTWEQVIRSYVKVPEPKFIPTCRGQRSSGLDPRVWSVFLAEMFFPCLPTYFAQLQFRSYHDALRLPRLSPRGSLHQFSRHLPPTTRRLVRILGRSQSCSCMDAANVIVHHEFGVARYDNPVSTAESNLKSERRCFH